MPYKPQKINRPWQPERKPFDRVRKPDAFNYNARKWRKLRSEVLTSEPLCRHCEAKGIATVATVVDHITRIDAGGAEYDKDNLQPLCKKCHDSKSGTERHRGGMG